MTFLLHFIDLIDCNVCRLSALQIFQKERHPSVYKVGTGNSGAKEGLSLFGKLISNIPYFSIFTIAVKSIQYLGFICFTHTFVRYHQQN